MTFLKVLHGSAWYPPHSTGGTEVFVAGLVRELRAHEGVDSSVVIPWSAGPADRYYFEGTTVRPYKVPPAMFDGVYRRRAVGTGLSEFRRVLDQEAPDVYHQHSWTRGLGLPHLQAASEAGLKTVLTVHVPGNICLRGTMMRLGKSACDGLIRRRGCSACWAQGRGSPRIAAELLSAIPQSLGSMLSALDIEARWATALSASFLAQRKQLEFEQMISCSDRVVAVSQWLFDALARNGAPTEKLLLSRQGTDTQIVDQALAMGHKPSSDSAIRLVYLGRWDETKGIEVVVRAIRSLPPDFPVTLDIHGIRGDEQAHAYERRVCGAIASDMRIRIRDTVPRDRLGEVLSSADALVVPSLCMETGPLVVLEAKAFGVPIIGSRLGGIAELVSEPDDGVLETPGDVEAWASAIRRFVEASPQPKQIKGRVRTMKDTAEEMATIYSALVGGAQPRSGEAWTQRSE